MSSELPMLSLRKRRAYMWGGWALIAVAAVATALNLLLPVPEYQKLSWFLVGFFWVGGIAGVAAARGAIPAGGKMVEYGEALIVAGLLAIAIRGAVVQAFKIPSGSMLPTLLIGDHLLVSKFLYGVRIPYSGDRVLRIRPPRRGDIVVFAYPEDDSKDFIKRVIGEPGDVVEVRRKVVHINGAPIDDAWGVHNEMRVEPRSQRDRDVCERIGSEQRGSPEIAEFVQEACSRGDSRDNFGPVTVPEGRYFVMGDNRDRSLDSRFWGFVEDARIKGKAFIIYWSWDSDRTRPRFSRMADWIE